MKNGYSINNKNTLRSRLLNNEDDIREQEERIRRIKQMGDEAVVFMRTANHTIVKDREGLFRMV